MPAYPHLLEDRIEWDVIQDRVDAMVMLNVPYDARALSSAEAMAREQADALAARLIAQGGPPQMADKDVIALIAYMQRLGMDIRLSNVGAK